MSSNEIGPINLARVKTYPIAKRDSKVRKEDFASLPRKGSSFDQFYRSLPNILKANEIRAVVDSILAARKMRKPILFMVGAHVIKCGLSPVLIDLMERKVITAIALNGAGMIHDFEVAFVGKTSEDVATTIEDGSFGMAEEPALFINQAITGGAKKAKGIGQAVGGRVWEEGLPNRRLSILAMGYRLKVPTTVHIAIGTDTIHQHPSCDGAAMGRGTLIDFRILASVVTKLGNGGVAINLGSAVVLPEVFLKAVAVARNLGHKVKDFTSANFDMIHHYRPHQNVVTRPLSLGGKGYSIIGHHEIMIPLLRQAIIERL